MMNQKRHETAIQKVGRALDMVRADHSMIKTAMGMIDEIKFMPALETLQKAFPEFHAKRMRRGNKKLSKKIGIFNILAGFTCETACKGCYALRPQKIRPNVRIFRFVNWILSKYYPKELITIIRDFIIAKRLGVVRIHESGDFFDLLYVHTWLEIIKSLPEVKFYFYTKTDRAVILSGLPNVNMVDSYLPNGEKNFGPSQWVCDKMVEFPTIPVCPSTVYMALKRHCKATHGVNSVEYIAAAQKAKDFICGEQCKICQTDRHVLFVAH